jgi:hypothetical protein
MAHPVKVKIPNGRREVNRKRRTARNMEQDYLWLGMNKHGIVSEIPQMDPLIN